MFYAIVAASVLLALVLQYLPIGPMQALVWSAVINGIVAVPLLVALMIPVSRRESSTASARRAGSSF
ncbi:MAG: hypothetical protein IIZ38_05195 [Sphingomonas sp.]|uniref:hypothetical protein n=1 Tax=unclassified Sphingomonas TaxID=196159 RepID=UPI00245716A9|nr:MULTISPECIES: hypothetical protein [unclassified Sphingomonas]MBQ1497691.1 hypothetical protein [Sphingomonas sp.]MBQ8102781.1 hypothetical protein [Afipia sp.]MDH4746621.1 hypothetical protein [Sphingomonas sp. CBMAI 2297]